MADFVGHPFVQALAWTLVHFLWQGAAIAIVALVLMRSSRLPWTRYAIGVGALAAMLVAPVVTLLLQISVSIVADAEGSLASALAPIAGATLPGVATDSSGALASGVPDIMFAAIVGLWLAGVGVFGLRLAGGWLVARRVARQAVRPAAAEIQRLALAVGERLGVRRAVTVLRVRPRPADDLRRACAACGDAACPLHDTGVCAAHRHLHAAWLADRRAGGPRHRTRRA